MAEPLINPQGALELVHDGVRHLEQALIRLANLQRVEPGNERVASALREGLRLHREAKAHAETAVRAAALSKAAGDEAVKVLRNCLPPSVESR